MINCEESEYMRKKIHNWDDLPKEFKEFLLDKEYRLARKHNHAKLMNWW